MEVCETGVSIGMDYYLFRGVSLPAPRIPSIIAPIQHPCGRVSHTLDPWEIIVAEARRIVSQTEKVDTLCVVFVGPRHVATFPRLTYIATQVRNHITRFGALQDAIIYQCGSVQTHCRSTFTTTSKLEYNRSVCNREVNSTHTSRTIQSRIAISNELAIFNSIQTTLGNLFNDVNDVVFQYEILTQWFNSIQQLLRATMQQTYFFHWKWNQQLFLLGCLFPYVRDEIMYIVFVMRNKRYVESIVTRKYHLHEKRPRTR